VFSIGSGLGACPVLDTGVKPDNDKYGLYGQTLVKNQEKGGEVFFEE
jgi:hypothetical protein